MHRIVWLTDLHLDFAAPAARDSLKVQVREAAPDAVLVGGDLGEARSVVGYLRDLADALDVPLYVVLGNHDFYGGGIDAVRRAVSDLAASNARIDYLAHATDPFPLTPTVALVGHDGWADGREGDYHRSLVMMHDYLLIDELARYTKRDRLAILHQLGDEAAECVRTQLARALASYPQVFLLTHVPPFRGACWYEGRVSDDEWAPHFVCQAVGHAILDVASLFPERNVTVLCGHTHHGGEYQPADNVRVITGGAEYGVPRITKIFDLA